MPVFLLWKIGEGFLVKTIASFDDTLTRIPVISYLTKTKRGRIAFSIGTLLALTVILAIALFFSSLLSLMPYTRQIAAILIFTLAILIYFDVFLTRSTNRLASKLSTIDSSQNLIRIMRMGFLVSFITLIDDSFVLVPLFLSDNVSKFASIIGVYLAAILQILAVIYFGERLERIKHKKELASASLLILSVLVFTSII